MYRESPYDDRAAPRPAPQHAAPTIYPARPRKVPWLALGAYFAGLLGLAAGLLSLALSLTWHGSLTAQLAQARHEVASQQSALDKARSDGAASFAALNGKVSSIDAVLAPYSMTCSTDLTGPSGPAQFWFACTDQRPG